jgi:hypothetical protein|tara:strand:+ start:276 stop:494 length:219 start_codon:yes stop_codon:yes gene_type:complete
MNFKDTLWFIGIVAALFTTWGMMSQRVTALETDVSQLEQVVQTFTKMETRLAVIETEMKNMNSKLDELRKKK